MKILFYEVRHFSPNFHEFSGSKTTLAKNKIAFFSPLIIYFYFLILMTVSASNLTLKLVLHHDELKNVNHVFLVEVSEIQILFH